MIISVVNHKGGSGKSTIVQNLAIKMTKELGNNEVLVIDTDNQKSIEMFANLRSEKEIEPALNCVNRSGKSLRECIKLNIEKYKIIIIDTAGNDNMESDIALTLSNVCIIPTTSSQYDLDTLLKVFDKVERVSNSINPYLKSFVLLNKISPNPTLQGERANLMKFLNTYKKENDLNISILDNIIYDRIGFKRLVTDGIGASELEESNKTRLDFENFYDELQKKSAK